MIEFTPATGIQKALFVGAHPDDIEIGAGGFVLRLIQQIPDVDVRWVVLASHDERRSEAMMSADRFLDGARSSEVHLESFRERYFPYQPEIKEYFDKLKQDYEPDIILSPWRRDRHQDHRTAAEVTLNSFRNHLILQYEVVKVDGDFGRPNIYLPLPLELAKKKVDLLMEMFPTQHGRDWFDPQVFNGIMRLRGVEARAESGFAEAFHCSPLVARL